MPTRKGGGVLTPEDVKELYDLPEVSIDNVIATRDRCLLLLFASTGMRVSEIARIDTRDVVENSLGHFAIHNVQRSPSGRTRRVVISEEVYSAIQDWLYVRPVQGPFVFMPTNQIDGERLWSDASLSLSEIRSIVAIYGKQMGIDYLCPHDLRRFATNHLVKQGFQRAARTLGLNPISVAKMLNQQADDVIDTNHLY